MVMPASALSTLVLVVAVLVVLLLVAQAVTLTMLVRVRRSIVRAAAPVEAAVAAPEPTQLDSVELSEDTLAVELEPVDDDAQLAQLEELSRVIAEHRAEADVETPVAVEIAVEPDLQAELELALDLADEDVQSVSKRTDRVPPPVLSKREVPAEELKPVPHAWELVEHELAASSHVAPAPVASVVPSEPEPAAASVVVDPWPVVAVPSVEQLPAYSGAQHVEVAPLHHAAPPPSAPAFYPPPMGHQLQQQPQPPQPMHPQQFQQLPYPPQPGPQEFATAAAHQEHSVPSSPPRMPPPLVHRDASAPRLPLTAPPSMAPPRPVPRKGEAHPAPQTEFTSIEEMAVSAVIDGGRPVPQVAQTLRVSTSLVAYWVAKSGRTRSR